MKEYIIDSNKFCGYIKTDDDGILLDTMPIVKIFIGQHISKLVSWTEKNFGFCKLKEINEI